ncbi:MAG: hypothetical protein SVY53_06325 [Chloroflexota bacterium]|nr:hypothetical protein [Chloroflexota bacterium]
MGLFGRKSNSARLKEQREEELRQNLFERLYARRGLVKRDPQLEATYHGNLMMVGAHLAQGCHPNGAEPEVMVATYTRVMSELMDWFNIVPIRQKLEPMLAQQIYTKWEPQVPMRGFYEPTLKKMARTSHYQAHSRSTPDKQEQAASMDTTPARAETEMQQYETDIGSAMLTW